MHRKKKEILALLAAFVFIATGVFIASSKNANAGAFPSLELVRQVPASGLPKLVPFSITCTTDATEIKPATDVNFGELYCENMSSTSVFYGDSTVTTSNAPCVQTTAATCPKTYFSLPVQRGVPHCIVASGTQAIKCLAG